MNEYGENFKGVRFPKKLWLDKSINFIEKGIIVTVKNLGKNNHCRATNGYLAEFLQCSVPTITRAIAHLKEIGYVEETEEGRTGNCRKLRVLIDIYGGGNQNDYTPNQNDYTPNQFDYTQPSSKGLDPSSKGLDPSSKGLDPSSKGLDPSSKGLPINIYNIDNINNNINNNIGENKNFCSADASPTNSDNVETELVHDAVKKPKKTKRTSQKQQRHNEVISSTEFNTILHEGLTDEKDIQEIDVLWNEFVELRCSKDYKAFTDGAVKRNLNVLSGCSPEEKKAILEKSVTKGWTGLFPLNDYDKQRIEKKSSQTEGTDEWLVDKMYTVNCKEKEDEVSEGTTHNLLMSLCETYGEERIKKLYYELVQPRIKSKYGIKRDWK